ncbi:MAG TPA: hypothetical protein VGI54_03770, partial [Solirubrobacteraceae bacterium]
RLLYDASLPRDDGSYRVVTYPWRATPRTRPVAVAGRRPGGAIIHVSWNGATAVCRWQVRARGKVVATAPWAGLETRIAVAGARGPFVVRALDARGRVLGASHAVRAPES